MYSRVYFVCAISLLFVIGNVVDFGTTYMGVTLMGHPEGNRMLEPWTRTDDGMVQVLLAKGFASAIVYAYAPTIGRVWTNERGIRRTAIKMYVGALVLVTALVCAVSVNNIYGLFG